MNRRTRIFSYKMIAVMIIVPSVALALFGCTAPPNPGTPAVNDPISCDWSSKVTS